MYSTELYVGDNLIVAGFPNLKFLSGMESEHCSQSDSKVEFVTLNYGLTTTPEQEWCTIIQADKSKETLHRVIPNYKELLKSETALRAQLLECEMVAVIMYTGPMVW